MNLLICIDENLDQPHKKIFKRNTFFEHLKTVCRLQIFMKKVPVK